jgi:hypothetical protein
MTTSRIPLLHRLLLAATLATGFGTVWFVLVTWLGGSIEELWRGTRRPPSEYLVVRSDGTPLIASVPRTNLSLTTYRDLNGRNRSAPSVMGRSRESTSPACAGTCPLVARGSPGNKG